MDKISSTSLITTQTFQKGVRRVLKRTPKWKLFLLATLILVPLIATGFICFAIPFAAFFFLLFSAFELRFTNPISNVWIDGDELLMERMEETERIQLANIREFKLRRYNNPPYCVTELKTPCRWGTTLTWFPLRMSSYGEMPTLIRELQNRADQASSRNGDS
ncbi:hypothetical protein [Rhodopirellula sallentina]|uniref:Secreted protein n=1 Tax=Rhodopirellula sallentina SM41 TaxID=1263870 RepID=M5U4B3_9BACT|nr:hypothetical protein [Rhodopirellula sallentina]EMI56285.1 secreted protein [Rhodopirellula sallentina SM41]